MTSSGKIRGRKTKTKAMVAIRARTVLGWRDMYQQYYALTQLTLAEICRQPWEQSFNRDWDEFLKQPFSHFQSPAYPFTKAFRLAQNSAAKR